MDAFRDRLPSAIIDRPKLPSVGTPRTVYGQSWFQDALDDVRVNPADVWDRDAVVAYARAPASAWNLDVLYRLVYLQAWLRERTSW